MRAFPPALLALAALVVLSALAFASSNYTIVTSCASYANNDTAIVKFKVVFADVPTCDTVNTLLAVQSPSGVNATYFPAMSCDTSTGIHSFLISTGESGIYTIQPFNDNTAYSPTNATPCSLTSYKRAQTRVPDANPLLALFIGVLAAGLVALQKRRERGR